MDLRQKWTDFSQETTMHGVQYVGKENVHWFRRLLWALTVLAMMGVASWMIVDKFIYFYSYPTETKTTIRNENRLDFPSVTLCNMNKFRKSQLVGNETYFLEIVMKSLFDPSTLSDEDIEVVETHPFLREIESVEEFQRVLHGYAHWIEDMVWVLNWRGTDLNVTDYFSTITTDEGVCYTFHSQEVQEKLGYTLNTTSTGTSGGLWLRMDIEQTEEYFFGPENSAGFKLLVHDPKKFPLVAELGFAVGPGTETFVSVKKNEVKSLPSPYEGSICRDTQKSGFKNHLTYFDSYNQPACRLECETKYIVEKCGCRIYYQPGFENYCTPYQLYDCANPAVDEYTRSATALSECDCFQECHTTSYEVSVSSALFPSQHILEDVQATLGFSEDFIRKNFLEVRVFFEEMNIYITEQKPAYEAGDLLADVGGTTGLFLGASLLTVMEILEFIFLTFTSFLKSLSATGKIPSKSEKGNTETFTNNYLTPPDYQEKRRSIFGSLFGDTKSETPVQKINVQEKT